MKKLFLALSLISIMSSCCWANDGTPPFGLESGEKLKQYSKNGSYQGYYKQEGTKLKEYNRNGSYQGYYKSDGNKIKHYNRNGSFQGYYKK